MIIINDIIESIKTKRIRINDGLFLEEIFTSVLSGEIIEQYPDDKPYPSCLIYGKNIKSDPVHSVWAYNRETRAAVLITVYRPDATRWVDWKIRRKT